MTKEELEQRLIELFEECMVMWHDNANISTIVAHLIANGVTIRERGEWKDNIFCSRCGYAAEDDEGYILMSFDDFCPHCGADMRGVKDE